VTANAKGRELKISGPIVKVSSRVVSVENAGERAKLPRSLPPTRGRHRSPSAIASR